MYGIETLIVSLACVRNFTPFVFGFLPVNTFRQFGTSIVFEDAAYSDAHHAKVPNNIHSGIHAVTNPFIALSLVSILHAYISIIYIHIPHPFLHTTRITNMIHISL